MGEGGREKAPRIAEELFIYYLYKSNKGLASLIH